MTRSFSSGRKVGCALLFGIFAFFNTSFAQQAGPPRKGAVQISAAVQEAPPRITLSWVDEGDALSYRVSRRTRDSGWQQIATPGGGETSLADANVALGTKYEYQIVKSSSAGYTGYGYISAGIRIPPVDYRGKVILIVESALAGAMGGELEQLQSDLTGDGWVVARLNVSASDSPQSVKDQIRAIYAADPNNVKAVFLMGHVPVPYSGNYFPDGHENHQGAWPADVYYGDVDGGWTDSIVNNTRAERSINWNVPGDGKFDQSEVPSRVELMVGRVDLSNLTCFANKAYARSELDLARQYLSKNHSFRFGEIAIERRALICDNFFDKGHDAIVNTAWRSFSTFFGPGKVTEVPWNGYFPAATQNSYLWSFASGGGSYYYSSGVGTSDDFALNDVRVVFAMFMGSYFGDWNNESNFLRASLGSGNILTATYSGAPHTLFFPMALGEPIGYAIQLTQQNATNALYPPWNQGAGQVHISLLGDPTLRMHPVRPPAGLKAASESGGVRLSWNPSSDSVLGYYVYRAPTSAGPYSRVTAEPLTAASYTDFPAAGSYSYAVKAVKLEQSGSGTYLNTSQAIFAAGSANGGPAGPLAVGLTQGAPGQMTLRITGAAGQNFKVQTSNDLRQWLDFSSGTLSNQSMEVPFPIDPSRKRVYFRTVSN